MKEFLLDEATRVLLSELNEQQQQCLISMRAIMQHAIRQNKLDGNWQMSQDGTKLICVDPPAAEDPTKKSTRKK